MKILIVVDNLFIICCYSSVCCCDYEKSRTKNNSINLCFWEHSKFCLNDGLVSM
ncbi:hypothetical protein Hanom_Chr06g00547361 [Helianthus anomalus]